MRSIKIFSIYMVIILSLSFIFIFNYPVYASSDDLPVIKTGSISGSFTRNNDSLTFTGSPNCFYSIGNYNAFNSQCRVMCYDFNKAPVFSYTDNGFLVSPQSGTFTYNYNDTVYTVYYIYCAINYNPNVTGFNIDGSLLKDNMVDGIAACKFFAFGVGDYDYELPDPPAEDIPDSDLDIKGLTCTLVNDQNNSVNWINTYKNRFNTFVNTVYNELTGTVKDAVVAEGDAIMSDTVDVVIPGVALIWDSPDISVPPPIKETDINYKVWIDGRSEIKYRDSLSGAIADFLDTSTVGSCAYNKLVCIHEKS